jgi:hypothetical protein
MGNTLFRFTVGVRLQVQIVGMLCGTPEKDAYQEIVWQCTGGGGTFAKTGGWKIALPGTNLNDVSDQADDLVVVHIWNKTRAF